LGPAVTTFPDPYPLSRRCRAAHLCDLGRGATLLCNTAAARPENTSIEKRLSVPERHLGGLAEFERELIRARTGEGRQRARARGVHLGRKPKLTPHQKREALARHEGLSQSFSASATGRETALFAPAHGCILRVFAIENAISGCKDYDAQAPD
jgi:hypothetical protein